MGITGQYVPIIREECFSSEANYLKSQGQYTQYITLTWTSKYQIHLVYTFTILFFSCSHAAVSMNIFRKERVNNHTSLPSAKPRRQLIPSTSLLTNRSSSAKPPAHWVLLMNCLNPTTSSTCLMMSPWSISKLFFRQLSLPQQMSLQEYVSCGQNF